MKRGYQRGSPTQPDIPTRTKPPDPPSGGSGVSDPPGTIRETCSCGATIEVPARWDGREILKDWRHMHRHVQQRDRLDDYELADKPKAETSAAVGETHHAGERFGFSPPVVEAGDVWRRRAATVLRLGGAES